MEYNIDKNNFRIELKGSRREIKKFSRCLVEVVDKHLLLELKSIKFKSELEQFNISPYQRIYLSKNSLLYVPNVGSNKDMRNLHFERMMENYIKAKENFLK